MPKYDPYAGESRHALDEYEYYEEMFGPKRAGRQAGAGGAGARHVRRTADRELVTELTDPVGLEAGLDTTYRPSRHEAEWLLSSLRSFYEETLITDVLAQIKGGKEASVYRCAAHPSTGVPLLAAKVYRPRMFRTLRNDAMYRQGRQILTGDGRPVKKTDHRIMRAIGKKTTFGVQVMHTSWLMHEFTTMKRLYEARGAVPRPVAASENAILMSYHGDARMAAPTLNQVRLDADEAQALLQEVLRNVELLLEQDLIHGDLSAYNILYWEGAITIIDFPQVTSSSANSDAYFVLQRDIERVCEYFSRQGAPCDAAEITDRLWDRYVEVEAGARAADVSVLMEEHLE